MGPGACLDIIKQALAYDSVLIQVNSNQVPSKIYILKLHWTGHRGLQLIKISTGYSHIFRYEVPEARFLTWAASSTSYLWALACCEYVVLVELVDPNVYCPQQHTQGIQPWISCCVRSPIPTLHYAGPNS